MRTRRLHVIAIGARIADVRIRERDNLAAIRGVSQDFLITGHRRIKNNFTDSLAIGPNRSSAEDCSVLKCQNSRRYQKRPSVNSEPEIASGRWSQMHKSGRTWPPARDFADRPAIWRSLLKRNRSRQTRRQFFWIIGYQTTHRASDKDRAVDRQPIGRRELRRLRILAVSSRCVPASGFPSDLRI